MREVSSELPPLSILLTHLEWNLKHLENILKNEATEYYRKAALQRYGFTVESALRCIRAGTARDGQECDGAQECFELAHAMGWLDAELDWQGLAADYNSLQPDSGEIPGLHGRLPSHAGQLRHLFRSLSSLPQ